LDTTAGTGDKEQKHAPPAFTIEQRLLPGLLGIAIERVRELRAGRLVKGEDWTVDRGRVLYADSGIAKLRAALALPAAIQEPDVEALEQIGKALRPRALVVRRAGPVIRNRRMVECTWEDEPDAGVVLLHVRDNLGFRHGQRIPAEDYRERGVPGQFDYCGRYPRRSYG